MHLEAFRGETKKTSIFLKTFFLKSVYYHDCHNYALTFKVILLTKKYLGNKLLYSSQFSRESISFDVSDTVSHWNSQKNILRYSFMYLKTGLMDCTT